VRKRSTAASTPPPSRELAPALLDWFRAHRRPLPWRADRDPYRRWVAEALLQQTRVAQAIPFFERFLRAFPTVEALARAPEGAVLKVWQGAGYYGRARRLRSAARAVVLDHDGHLPTTVEEWERLPGVGPYIARALASQVSGVPVVALEANGLRVAARWTLETGALGDARVRGRLATALEAALPARAAGDFNEAVMELGETVCRPVTPRCSACPVNFACRAHAELADPGSIPAPARRERRPHVRAAVTVLEHDGKWLVQRRPSDGLLGGLWEFPGGKVEAGERPAEAAARELREETGLVAPPLTSIGTVEHAYSHFSVSLHVFRGMWTGPSGAGAGPARRWVTPAAFARLPLPKATEKVLARLAGAGTASPGSGSRQGRTPSGRPRAGASRPDRAPVRRTRASTDRRRARH
jgi:A/G-specific adenine glycosylase